MDKGKYIILLNFFHTHPGISALIPFHSCIHFYKPVIIRLSRTSQKASEGRKKD